MLMSTLYQMEVTARMRARQLECLAELHRQLAEADHRRRLEPPAPVVLRRKPAPR